MRRRSKEKLRGGEAMTKLENHIAEAGRIQPDTNATAKEGNAPAEHSTIQ
jgi:hypothetical protein